MSRRGLWRCIGISFPHEGLLDLDAYAMGKCSRVEAEVEEFYVELGEASN